MEESYGCVSDWGKMSKQGEREKKKGGGARTQNVQGRGLRKQQHSRNMA